MAGCRPGGLPFQKTEMQGQPRAWLRAVVYLVQCEAKDGTPGSLSREDKNL